MAGGHEQGAEDDPWGSWARGYFGRSDDLTALNVWQFYKTLPEFEKVCFDQFEARLETHREQASKNRQLSKRDLKAMEQTQRVNERSAHNSRGEPVFDMSKAKLLLRQDVIDGIHIGKVPSAFQLTRPAEYMRFKPEKFKERLYQEIRRKKFLHHLALKRATELAAPRRSKDEFAARHNQQSDSDSQHQEWFPVH